MIFHIFIRTLNTFTCNVIKLCLHCLLSTESKLIILVIVAETKFLNVVNLLFSFMEETLKKNVENSKTIFTRHTLKTVF